MKYCYYRVFDNLSTNYLLKSFGKLQELIDINKEYRIRLQS